MKAIRMTTDRRAGGARIRGCTGPPFRGPGEVLIDVESIGINFIDTYVRRGLYPRPLPLISRIRGGRKRLRRPGRMSPILPSETGSRWRACRWDRMPRRWSFPSGRRFAYLTA